MITTQISDIVSAMQIGCDTTFELNEFGEPRLRSEIETIKDILLFILLTKPGQYPSLPTIGYDIESKLYSFYDDIKEDDIIEDICEQCEALRTYFNSGQVALRKYKYKDQPAMMIMITGQEKYPSGYRHAAQNQNDKYLIGLTYDEVNKLIYDTKKI